MSTPACTLPTPRRGRPPTPGLRTAILAAAATVFGRRPYHEVLMDEVAGVCGVGKGTLYRYFASKRDLYLAITFDGMEQLQADVEAIGEGDGTPLERLERLVRRLLGHFWDRRVFFALIHGGEGDDPDALEWVRRRAALARVVERVLSDGMEAGTLRPLDTRLAAEMLFGMLRGANRYHGVGDSLEGMVALAVDVFLRGVGA